MMDLLRYLGITVTPSLEQRQVLVYLHLKHFPAPVTKWIYSAWRNCQPMRVPCNVSRSSTRTVSVCAPCSLLESTIVMPHSSCT